MVCLKKYLIGGGAFDAVLILLALLFSSLSRTELIIRFGVGLTDLLLVAGWVVLGALAVAGNALWITLAVKHARRNRLPGPAPKLTLSPKEQLDPMRIREELLAYKKQRPALQQAIDQAISQMDSMDRKQEKLGEVFERNRVQTLGEVAATVDDTEQALCRNMVKIINRITIWDPQEVGKKGKEEIFREHRAYILKFLDRNDELLLMCDKLLAETVCYVDEKDATPDQSALHLQVMTETIGSLRNMNRISD
ncbi:hypothetical protein LJC49_03325 [Ruminococcaceae bacterium OttesenSCG-928-I18]|nr:hypothetical protein [Ruminococcaceae bacterium OttesenSCG-928-I18]